MSDSRTLRRSTLAVAVTSILLGTAGGTAAQEGKGSLALDEIVVTATKRTETLQDVPISLGVVTGDTIEKYGLLGFEDLQNYVPNLLVQETLGSYQIRIRGLGSGAAQLSFASAVGFFSDGVYCGRPRCFQEPMLDVERVEVVRGPQGALFGKNTIAGAVSVTSARPTEEFDGRISAGTELEEGGYNVQGHVSGPVTDGLGARLAWKYEDVDGFIKNISTGDDENAIESYTVRGSFQWDATDSLRIFGKAEVAEKDIDGYTSQLIGYGGYGTRYSPGETRNGVPVAGQLIPFSKPEKLDDETSTRTIFPDGQWDETDSGQYALNVDWDIGEYTLTAITGFSEFDFTRRVTATSYSELFVDTEISEDYEQFSQELRLNSPEGGLFDYIAGLYYSSDESEIAQWSPFATPPGLLAISPPYTTMIRAYEGETETMSAYFSGTFHLLDDRARVTMGLRYGEEDIDGHSTGTNGIYDQPTNSFVSLPDFVYRPIGASNREFNVRSSREEDYLDPSISLQFDATEEIMVYASYAKGSKSGGFLANDGTVGNNILAQQVADPTWAQRYAGMPVISEAQLLAGITLKPDNGVYDYSEEQADSYEIGAKMQFLDGAMNWNLAAYYTEFDDLQTSQYDGVRFITRNAATAVSQGVESELDWRLTEHLTLSWDIAYLDAYYDDYTNTFCKVIAEDGTQADPSCVNGRGDLSDEALERAPEWESTFMAAWESNITDGLLLRLNGSVYYSDEYYIQANVSPLYTQDDFFKYDLRVAVADADDTWEVALIGRNLSDELTLQHAYLVGRYSAASVSSPRYVTLQGTYNF